MYIRIKVYSKYEEKSKTTVIILKERTKELNVLFINLFRKSQVILNMFVPYLSQGCQGTISVAS